MQELHLAKVISRLYESEFETSSIYKRILQKHMLGQARQLPDHQDTFLSCAAWRRTTAGHFSLCLISLLP